MKAVRLGREPKIITTHTDITRIKQSEIQLEASVKTAGDAIINIDQSGVIQLFNPAAEKLFGYKTREIMGKNIKRLIPDLHKAKLANGIAHFLKKNEIHDLKKDGTVFPLFLSMGKTIVEGKAGFTGFIHDLTEAKKTYEQLRLLNEQLHKKNKRLDHLSTTDQLTGLYNRRHLETKAEEFINRCERYGEQLSLILIDIDHFKHVNDKYGHDIGDDVLVSISEILRLNSRKVDVVGRWGGEEFLILLFQSGQQDSFLFAEKLRTLIMDAGHHKAGKLTASFGITHYASGGQSLFHDQKG